MQFFFFFFSFFFWKLPLFFNFCVILDGTNSISEFKDFMHAIGVDFSKKLCEKLFRRIDKNFDNSVRNTYSILTPTITMPC